MKNWSDKNFVFSPALDLVFSWAFSCKSLYKEIPMIKRFCFMTLIVVALSFTNFVLADVFYVASDGSDTSPYDTWAKAATDPQVAIDLAADTSGGPHQVWVKKGVYKPQFNPHTETIIPREFCFALCNNVEIYGGFIGSETLLSQMDYETNQTILSGDRGDPDTWANGTEIVEGTVFNPPPTGDPSQDLPVGNNSTNCYHVIYNPDQLPQIDATAVLDGFIITGGNADSTSPNDAGGGIYNYSSSPTLSNCTVSGNVASGGGGGTCNYSGASTILINCNYLGNLSLDEGYYTGGGGIYNYYSTPTFINCIIIGNLSYDDGGGLYNVGANISLTNCIFTNNSASAEGGINN